MPNNKLVPANHVSALERRQASFTQAHILDEAKDMNPQYRAVVCAALNCNQAVDIRVKEPGQTTFTPRTIPFAHLIALVLSDPAGNASQKEYRIKEAEAMRVLNLGVDSGSPAYYHDLATFRKKVKELCGSMANPGRYEARYGKAKSRGNLSLTLVGLRHLWEAREGVFGIAMRELLMRLEARMGALFQKDTQDFAALNAQLESDRKDGIAAFREGASELQAASASNGFEISMKSAQGVMAAVDKDCLKKITGCPAKGKKIRKFIEEETGLAMHQAGSPAELDNDGRIVRAAVKPKAFNSRLTDDLDVSANRAMAVCRLVTANHVPKVQEVLKAVVMNNAVPAKVDDDGAVMCPAMTSGVGMKRALMHTSVHDAGTDTYQNLNEGLDQILAVMNHGNEPLEKRFKLHALMAGADRRVLV